MGGVRKSFSYTHPCDAAHALSGRLLSATISGFLDVVRGQPGRIHSRADTSVF